MKGKLKQILHTKGWLTTEKCKKDGRPLIRKKDCKIRPKTFVHLVAKYNNLRIRV